MNIFQIVLSIKIFSSTGKLYQLLCILLRRELVSIKDKTLPMAFRIIDFNELLKFLQRKERATN